MIFTEILSKRNIKNTKIFILNIGGLPHYNTNNAEELYNNISNSDIYILCFAHTNLN